MPSTEATEKQSSASASPLPTLAGVFQGLGLGGFFGGIVLHKILQWHHMATSAGYRLAVAKDRKTAVNQCSDAAMQTGSF